MCWRHALAPCDVSASTCRNKRPPDLFKLSRHLALPCPHTNKSSSSSSSSSSSPRRTCMLHSFESCMDKPGRRRLDG